MKDNKKLSARRCGRVLAIMYLEDHLDDSSFEGIPEHYKEELLDYMPELSTVPQRVQEQAYDFADELIKNILAQKSELIALISKSTKNRTWDRFYPLDKALLIVGAYSMENDAPGLIVKEILISGDILENQNAAPYISGILKSIADKEEPVKKNPKIRLKHREEDNNQ